MQNSLPDISDSYNVSFLQEPRDQQKLNVLESMWKKYLFLNAEITTHKKFYQNITNFS